MEHRTSNIIVCVFDEAYNKWSVRKIDDYKSSDNFTAIILTEPYTTKQEEILIDLPKDASDKDIIDSVSMLLQEYLGQRFPANASFEIFQEHITRTSVLCCKLSTLIMAFLLPFLSLSAETEIIYGIEWCYYVKNGYAVLEHPETRRNYTRPQPAHSVVSSEVLEIPCVLGGLPVREIGIGAIQLDSSTVAKTLIVPESATTISSAAFLGSYTKTELSGRYHYYYYEPIAIQNIIFKGDKPDLSAPNYWGINSEDYRCLIRGGPGFSAWCVEGYDGWVVNNRFSYSTFEIGVLYGAAKVDMYPADGICQNGTISLSCTNSSAVLRYTTDGSVPVTNAAPNCYVYEGPISITHRTTMKAIACVDGYPYTVPYTKEFALGKAQAPSISASQPLFNWSGNMVTLATETANAEIRYTLDGSEPTERNCLYTGPFVIDNTTTVKAKAFKEDWFESETATATFTREWYTVVTPVIEPAETTFENVSQTISLSCVTEGATILYTTDGSYPKTNGREYKNPFTIYDSCTIRAIAVKYDWKDSEEITATFTRAEGLSEAVNLYGYLMETDTGNPWTVVTDISHDGVSCVRSGAISHGGMTWLQTSMRKAGRVSFWWKAACEEAEEEDGETYWYDYGSFFVDGVEKAKIAGNDTGWHKVEVDVTSGGKHTLRWEYTKDGATSYSPDCIWLDQVQWIPADGSGYTLTTPEPVPYSWLIGFNLGLDSDFETAAKQAMGKVDANGRQMAVWQDYVAGTDPTNQNDLLRAVIAMSNDVPIVTWTPNLNTNGEVRVYTVMGKTNLTDATWKCPTNAAHRFFKVKVEMP